MKKNDNMIPFSNPIKKLKDDFKRTIDEMSDDDFLDMMHFLMESDIYDEFDDEEFVDEEFKDPFSGEMINFKCKKCKKISAVPVEVADEIYEAKQEQPDILCYHCDCIAVPMYYKSPDNHIFQN